MPKRMLWISIALFAGALLALPAPAQQEELQGFKVSLGAFFPSKAISRDESKTWFHGNLEYIIQRGEATETGYHYDLSVSAGYYGTSNLYNVPVLVHYTGYLNEQFFYTAGVGIGFARRIEVVGSSKEFKNKTGFAYSFGFGYNFSTGATPVALVVRYGGVTNTDNQHNGFSALLQFQF